MFWFHASFLRHYDETKTLLNSQHQFGDIGADGEQLEVYADRPEAAFQHFEHAIRLSPLDPMNFNNFVGIASAHQISGDYSESADLFERALMERPSAYWIYRNLVPALLAAGRCEDAEAAKHLMLKAYPAMTVKRFKDAMVFSPKALESMAVYLRELGIPEE